MITVHTQSGTVERREEQHTSDDPLVISLRSSGSIVLMMGDKIRDQLPDAIKHGRSISPISVTGLIGFGSSETTCLFATRDYYGNHQIDISPQRETPQKPFHHLFLEYDDKGRLTQFAIEHTADPENWLLKTDFTLIDGKVVVLKQTVRDNTFFDNPQKGNFWKAYKRLERLARQDRLNSGEIDNLKTMRRLVKELRQKFVLRYYEKDGSYSINVGILLSNKDLVENRELAEGIDRNSIAEIIGRVTNFQPAFLKNENSSST